MSRWLYLLSRSRSKLFRVVRTLPPLVHFRCSRELGCHRATKVSSPRGIALGASATPYLPSRCSSMRRSLCLSTALLWYSIEQVLGTIAPLDQVHFFSISVSHPERCFSRFSLTGTTLASRFLCLSPVSKLPPTLNICLTNL